MEWPLSGARIASLNVRVWAFWVRPLYRPKAASRLSGTVGRLGAPERPDLVFSGQAAFRRQLAIAAVPKRINYGSRFSLRFGVGFLCEGHIERAGNNAPANL